MFDPECDRLARHFLPDSWFPSRERFASELAQHIQNAIEAWLDDKAAELERQAALARPRTDH